MSMRRSLNLLSIVYCIFYLKFRKFELKYNIIIVYNQ